MANVIKFSTNWNNKLTNKAFTTIRIHNPGKYIVGSIYEIELNGTKQGTATLRSKRTLSLSQLNDFICFLDTGYNKEETVNIIKRMYKDINIYDCLFDFCLLVYQSTAQKKKVQPTQQKMYLPYKD